MKHILFVFFFVFGCAMPTMVYAQTNSGGVHTITRGGSKTKPSNSGTSNKKKPKVKKNTTTTRTSTVTKNSPKGNAELENKDTQIPNKDTQIPADKSVTKTDGDVTKTAVTPVS